MHGQPKQPSRSLRDEAALRARAVHGRSNHHHHDDDCSDDDDDDDDNSNGNLWSVTSVRLSPPQQQPQQQPPQPQQQPYGENYYHPPVTTNRTTNRTTTTTAPLSSPSPWLQANPTNNPILPVQQQSPPPPPPPTLLGHSNNNNSNAADAARTEWRRHGTARTQPLEDVRYGRHPPLTFPFHTTTTTTAGSTTRLVVHVLSAQPRTDPSGASYTAYLIRVRRMRPSLQQAPLQQAQQQQPLPHDEEWFIEHRYSDFAKLHALLQQQQPPVSFSDPSVTFPSKHWAGRLGPWTPSASWAPSYHQDLIHARTIQLDVWLVYLVQLYNAATILPRSCQQAVHDFLVQPPRAPCEQVNDEEEEYYHHHHHHHHHTTSSSSNTLMPVRPREASWKWNNPLVFTLGSSIRQATRTVHYMMGGGSSAAGAAAAAGRSSSRSTTRSRMGPNDQGIPLDLLHAAKGLCFLTVAKAGLVVSGRIGTGLVLAQAATWSNNGPQQQQPQPQQPQQPQQHYWSAPCAIATVGLGWGALIGGDVTHYLIVLTTERAVRDLVSSSQSVQLGAEFGIAVGPLGRGANSQLQTGDWTLHSAYAYAHSQGLFVGMSLEGSVITVRHDVNAKFYGQPCQPLDILRQAPGPKAAEPLYRALQEAWQRPIPEGSFRPSQLFSPSAKSTAATATAPLQFTPYVQPSAVSHHAGVATPTAHQR